MCNQHASYRLASLKHKAVWTTICALLLGCKQKTGILVAVEGLHEQVSALAVRVTQNQRTAKKDWELTGSPLSPIALEFLPENTGQTKIEVDALSQGRFVLSSGSTSVGLLPDTQVGATIRLNKNEHDNCVSATSTWCFESPLPSGQDINGIWSFAANDVWAVGSRSLLLKWNGDRWTQPAQKPDIIDGNYGIWAGSSTAVFVTSFYRGRVQRWDGMGWVEYPGSPVPARHTWGISATDIWSVGRFGQMSHFDGSSWTPRTSNPATTEDLWGVHGTAANDVWMVGDGFVTLHYDGTNLERKPGGSAQDALFAVWASAPDGAVWGVARQGRIENWNRRDNRWDEFTKIGTDDLYAIAGIDPNDIWVVGNGGTVLRWNGIEWRKIDSGVTNRLTSLSVRDKTDVWIAGNGGTLLHYGGETLMPVAGGVPSFYDVWGTDEKNLWAVGRGGAIYQYDGTLWRKSVSPADYDLLGIWGSGATDIWAVGRGKTLHYDGTWSVNVKAPDLAYSVWGADRDNVWAGGDFGQVWHYTGQQWIPDGSSMTKLTNPVYAISGSGPDNVWAVADGTQCSQLLPSLGWTLRTPPVSFSSKKYALAVFSPNDVWLNAKDGNNSAYHYVGNNNWMATPMGASGFTTFYQGAPGEFMWAAGQNGKLYYYDGSDWRADYNGNASFGIGEGAQSTIYRLFGFGKDQLWAVGEDGVILRYKP